MQSISHWNQMAKMKRSAKVSLNSDWGKQGKLFAHPRQCCFKRIWSERLRLDFSKAVAWFASPTWSTLARAAFGKLWKTGRSRDPHASPGRLSQCHKAALKPLTYLLSGQAAGHKVGILNCTSADEVYVVEPPGLPAWTSSHCVPFCTETHIQKPKNEDVSC